MDRPDVSPALLRIAGDDYAENLRKRLIELSEETDDKAYASRLRLVASGQRPLRTLLSDPKWQESFQTQMQTLAEPPALDEEQRRALDDAVEQARQRIVTPSAHQVAADAADVRRRAQLTAEAIRQDELNGWTHVYDDDSDGSESADRRKR